MTVLRMTSSGDVNLFWHALGMREKINSVVAEWRYVKTGELDPWAFDKVAAIIQHGDEEKGMTSGVSPFHSPPPITRVDNLGPGSLVIFAGIESLHRVTPVTETVRQGKSKSPRTERVERINAILTYESQPGKRMNKYGLKKFFGRNVDA